MSKNVKTAIRIAKELCYTEDIINRLKDAKSDLEIERILAEARSGGYKHANLAS